MKKIQPIGGNILVKVAKNEKTTESGIVIPDTASEEKSQEGLIIAVGDGDKINEKIKKGVSIIYKKYSGSEIEIGGEEHVVLDAKEDVLAIIE